MGKLRKHEAFGEKKTVREWVEDDRCVVKNHGTLSGRIYKGRFPTVEVALTAPVGPAVHSLPFYEAFGEKKAIREWAEDDRCAVPIYKLRRRLRKGWSPEEAISRPFAKDELAEMHATRKEGAD